MAGCDVRGLRPSWPVIGREPELARIAEARESGARAVLVEAPPGIGKTRVAREALARAELQGAHTRWVQATLSAAGIPLGPFASMIAVDVPSDDRFELFRGATQS